MRQQCGAAKCVVNNPLVAAGDRHAIPLEGNARQLLRI